MKAQISQFIVEVGRKCNRQCAHCLRGAMEDVTIDIEYVKHIINQVSYIGCITFTGGEPTLYSKEIAEIVDYIVDNHVEVGGFYIASNGEIYSHELMTALIKLYAHSLEFGDNELTAYDVSNDQFHSPNPDVIAKLKAFSFFSQRNEIPAKGLIAEGFAKDTGYRYLNYDKKFYVSEYPDYDGEDTVYEFDMLYLNALGKMLADCDYSFASQRNIDAPAYNEISLVDLALNEKYSNIE